jgi:hypothetical protein
MDGSSVPISIRLPLNPVSVQVTEASDPAMWSLVESAVGSGMVDKVAEVWHSPTAHKCLLIR